MQLKAMSVEYVAVHGPDSKEFYRDQKNPTKFEGLLERVYHQEGDSIYRVPFTSYAHLVRKDEIPAALPVGGNVKLIEPYLPPSTMPRVRNCSRHGKAPVSYCSRDPCQRECWLLST